MPPRLRLALAFLRLVSTADQENELVLSLTVSGHHADGTPFACVLPEVGPHGQDPPGWRLPGQQAELRGWTLYERPQAPGSRSRITLTWWRQELPGAGRVPPAPTGPDTYLGAVTLCLEVLSPPDDWVRWEAVYGPATTGGRVSGDPLAASYPDGWDGEDLRLNGGGRRILLGLRGRDRAVRPPHPCRRPRASPAAGPS
jgi:hypothetical protein